MNYKELIISEGSRLRAAKERRPPLPLREKVRERKIAHNINNQSIVYQIKKKIVLEKTLIFF